MLTAEERIEAALETILTYGGIDGGHHKQWVLDQVVRTLSGEAYGEWVKVYRGEYDEDNEEFEYEWDEGIAP